MKTLLVFLLGCVSVVVAQDTKPLSVLVGHWEGGGTFQKTAMSEAGEVSSSLDCAWSPQGRYLICEQLVKMPKNSVVQLATYAPVEGETFRFYRLADTGEAHTGKVTIHGATWTFDDNFTNGDGKKTEVRTTNQFTGDEEVFKTEFSVEGGPWTTMLEGKMHRTKK